MRRQSTTSAPGGVGRTCILLGFWKCLLSISQEDVWYTGVGARSMKVKPRVGFEVEDPPAISTPVSSGFSLEHQERCK